MAAMVSDSQPTRDRLSCRPSGSSSPRPISLSRRTVRTSITSWGAVLPTTQLLPLLLPASSVPRA
eukprot:14400059-Alexandrium_andersonii.AAC.1